MQNDITNYFKNFISALLQLPFSSKTTYYSSRIILNTSILLTHKP